LIKDYEKESKILKEFLISERWLETKTTKRRISLKPSLKKEMKSAISSVLSKRKKVQKPSTDYQTMNKYK